MRNRPALDAFPRLPDATRRRIYGKGVSSDPTSYKGKEKAVAFSDDIYAVIDALGICKFLCQAMRCKAKAVGCISVCLDYVHTSVNIVLVQLGDQ